jgi:hypothetical protein
MQLKISIPVHTKGITMTECIVIIHLQQWKGWVHSQDNHIISTTMVILRIKLGEKHATIHFWWLWCRNIHQILPSNFTKLALDGSKIQIMLQASQKLEWSPLNSMEHWNGSIVCNVGMVQ